MEDAIKALDALNNEDIKTQSVAILERFYHNMTDIGPLKLRVILANEKRSCQELMKSPDWRVQSLGRTGLANAEFVDRFITGLFDDIWKLMSINTTH